MLWYGYRHIYGSLHVKRYFSKDDLDEVFESDFVEAVYGPWNVRCRKEAVEKFKKEVADFETNRAA